MKEPLILTMGKEITSKNMNNTNRHKTNNNIYPKQKINNNDSRSTHHPTNNNKLIEKYEATNINSVNTVKEHLTYDNTPNKFNKRKQINEFDKNGNMQEKIHNYQEADDEESESGSDSDDGNEQQKNLCTTKNINNNNSDTPSNHEDSSIAQLTNTEGNNIQHDANIVIGITAQESVYGKRYTSLTREEVNQLTTYTRNVFPHMQIFKPRNNS